jgi:Kdo2-lipid IVA lauroyltransferase/acyltransferase
MVTRNVQLAFPEKSEKEVKQIVKEFFSHFCDVMIESIKLFNISEAEMQQRIPVVNREVFDEYYDKGKSLVVVTSHIANWEWAGTFLPNYGRHMAVGLYKPLSNKFFDELMVENRGRFGTHLVSTREVGNFYEKHKDVLTFCGFIADQRPSDPSKGYWMKFLGRYTPILLGSEIFAKKYDMPVVYAELIKIKRGYYKINLVKVCDDPINSPKFEITRNHTIILENLIKRQPAYWLWTHNKWKHEDRVNEFLPAQEAEEKLNLK